VEIEYQAPASLKETVALLAEKGERTCLIAGGSDLLVWLYQGLLEADVVVDVQRIPELSVLQFSPTDGLTIGAAVPWCRVCEHPQVAAFYPCLSLVARLIRSIPVKGRATLGSNLCTTPASSDAIPALIALEATCNIAGPQGQRAVPVEQLWAMPGQTTLGRGEMLVSVHLPVPRPHSGAWYIPFYPGDETDMIYVRVAASLALNDDDGEILAARVVLGAAAPTPLLLNTVSAVLVGQAPSEPVLDTAAALARVATWPTKDAHGNAVQRAQVAGLLTRRALCGALLQAKREIQPALHQDPGGLTVSTKESRYRFEGNGVQ